MNWRSTTYLELQARLREYFAMRYLPSFNYQAGFICHYQSQWYVCINATTGAFNSANWQLIPSPTTTQHGNYNPNFNYVVGDYCLHLGYLYQCTAATTGNFNAANWNAIRVFRHLRWVDVFNNQYNYFEEPSRELPIPLPAIFIEFHQTDWQNLKNGGQTGETLIRIHVVQESYHQSYDGSSDQLEGLDRFDFLEQVNLAIHGASGTYFSNLTRVAETLDNDHSNVIVHILDYFGFVIDDSAVKDCITEEIKDVHVNPDYDNAVGNFNDLGNDVETALNNNPEPVISNNPYFIPPN